MERRSYDTSLKHLVRLGLASGIAPELLSSVPRTNLCRWRHEDACKYEGHELNQMALAELELLRAFSEHRSAKRTFSTYLRLLATCRGIVRKSGELKAVFARSRAELLDAVQRAAPSIGTAKALKFLGISRTTFQNWLLEAKVKCDRSYFGWCSRNRPYQLTRPEVSRIKELVLDEKFRYWPLSSIYHHAWRNDLLHVHLSTFYKYVRLLGIKRHRYVKPPSGCGIRASGPHGIWHTDVTIVKLNGVRFYLHLLVDNYSRYILDWRLVQNLSGATVRDMLQAALGRYRPDDVQLLVDGGSENNNREVEQLLVRPNHGMRKVIAQRDIDFSNSMVEAVNNLLKNRYLQPKAPTDVDGLYRCVALAVHDVNDVRPHHALGGLTPFEALSGARVDMDERRKKREQSRMARLEDNRKEKCKGCS